MLVATALFALTVAAPTCGPLDLQTALALALARSDEVGIKRSEAAAAEADKAVALAVWFLPEFYANVPVGVVPGAALKTQADGTKDRNNISAIESGSNRGLTDLGAFVRVEVNALQPLWTWGRLKAARDAAEAGAQARGTSSTTPRTPSAPACCSWSWASASPRASWPSGPTSRARSRRQTSGSRSRSRPTTGRSARRIATGSRSSAASSPSGSPTGSGRSGSRRSGWRRPWPWSRTSSSSGRPLPDTSKIQAPDLEAAVGDATRMRPDLKALDSGILAKEADVRASRAELFHQVGLLGQFAYSRAAGRDTINNPYVGDYFNALTIGAAREIRQNLSFWNVIARTNKKEAELDTLRKQRAGAVQGIRVEVETAAADLTAAITKREASAKAVAMSRSWFRSATLNFGVGVADARDLIDAYRGYAEAQYGDAQATFDLLAAEARLEQVTGRMPPTPELNCQMP